MRGVSPQFFSLGSEVRADMSVILQGTGGFSITRRNSSLRFEYHLRW